MLLMLVSHSPQNISQKDLSEMLQITPAAVAMTLKKLEANGYISRQVDVDDNRVNRIRLLPKGEETVKFSEESFVSVDDAMFNGITSDELSLFIRTMEKINSNLTALCDDKHYYER
jgi:DNA-binding MarR family transcriptional regulator